MSCSSIFIDTNKSTFLQLASVLFCVSQARRSSKARLIFARETGNCEHVRNKVSNRSSMFMVLCVTPRTWRFRTQGYTRTNAIFFLELIPGRIVGNMIPEHFGQRGNLTFQQRPLGNWGEIIFAPHEHKTLFLVYYGLEV